MNICDIHSRALAGYRDFVKTGDEDAGFVSRKIN